MINNLNDFKYIMLLVNRESIAIFPISKSERSVVLADGSKEEAFLPVFQPIEIKFPFNREELARKIEYGMNQWNKHKCYDVDSPQTLEEKYYNIKGYKKAVKGIRNITLGWDDIQGKYVSLSLPVKSGNGYIGIDDTELAVDATWEDYAKVVLTYVNADLTEFSAYKTYKTKLNL